MTLLQARAACLSLLALLTVSLAAQTNASHVAILNNGRTVVYLNHLEQRYTATPPDAGLVTIYSNLGTGTNVYNGLSGSGVLGKRVPGQPFPEWLAYSFVPTDDHLVTELQVAVSYVSGTEEAVISLNADDGTGLPGQELQAWHTSSLPQFGSCCALKTAMSTTGVPVTKGTTYWVVVRTNWQGLDTWDVWNNDYNDFQGHLAVNHGRGWIDGGIQSQGAFGVFGQ